MSTSTMNTVTDRVTDVLTSGAGVLSSGAGVLVEQIEALPERVADLTGSNRHSSRRQWVLLAAAALIAFAGVTWWMRGRRHSVSAVDSGIDDGANPVRSHADRAVAAATGR